MNTNAKKLVVALKSGEYKQVRSALHEGDGYCCLGVACDVFSKLTGRGKWGEPTTDLFDTRPFELDGLKATISLPPEVRDFFGFSSNDGRFGDNCESSLMRLNDSDGKTFDEIADTIASEPKGLFA